MTGIGHLSFWSGGSHSCCLLMAHFLNSFASPLMPGTLSHHVYNLWLWWEYQRAGHASWHGNHQAVLPVLYRSVKPQSCINNLWFWSSWCLHSAEQIYYSLSEMAQCCFCSSWERKSNWFEQVLAPGEVWLSGCIEQVCLCRDVP